ncbi:MAG: hypothetical protein ACI4WW_02135 [Candidatus Coprovivens sp.]
MNLLFLNSIGDTIVEGFYGICLFIDGIIFSFIGSAFRIFFALASARFFTNTMYTSIANSIYFIIGVAMLFVLSYAILKGVIDPDQMSKGDLAGPKTVKRVLIAVLGMALVPVIFNIAYQAQGIIIDNNVIGKIIFRSTAYDNYSYNYQIQDENGNNVPISGEVNPDSQIDEIGGNYTSLVIWQALFRPAIDTVESDENGNITADAVSKAADEIEGDTSRYYKEKSKGWFILGAALLTVCAVVTAIPTGGSSIAADIAVITAVAGGASMAGAAVNGGKALLNQKKMTLNEAYTYAGSTGDFGIFSMFVPNIAKDGDINYNWPVTTICGCFVCYAFISFSIDMGERAAKLAYYQIIAPVPLIMQIVPKFESNFKKYLSSVLSTMLEVVIRILIIYIVVYLICHLTEMFNTIDFSKNNLNAFETTVALALFIIGLIIFTKDAPKVITGSLGIPEGKMKFGIGEKLAKGEVFTAGAALGSMATSGVRNFRNTWRNNENGSRFRLGKSLLSAAGGVGSAGVRSTRDRIRGGKDGFIKNPHEMRDRAHTIANETDDARERRKEWKETHGITPEDSLLTSARKSVVGHAADAGKTINAWSLGTIRTDKEERDMKYVKALDGLKGDLRAEAYKKDKYSQVLKDQHDAKAQETVSEFRDGWNQQTMNDEINRRLNDDHKIQQITRERDLKRTAAETAAADLRAAKKAFNDAGGDSSPNAATLKANITNAQAAYDATQADLDASEKDLAKERNLRRDTITKEVTAEAKLSSEEYSKAMLKHQAEVDGLRVAMEAAADSWVAEKAADETSNIRKMMNEHLQQYSSYISNYGTSVLFEKDGKEITVADLVGQTFGADVARTGEFSDKAKDFFNHANNSFEFEDKATKKVTRYVRTEDGKSFKNVDDGTTISYEDFFTTFIREQMEKGNEYKSKSSISRGTGDASDAYKDINARYTKKVQQKREQEQKK